MTTHLKPGIISGKQEDLTNIQMMTKITIKYSKKNENFGKKLGPKLTQFEKFHI